MSEPTMPNGTMIDIGANLSNKSFKQDLDEVIERAKQHALDAIIVTGTDLSSSRQAIALSEQHPNYLYATAGLHPHHADDFTTTLKEALQQLIQHPKTVAVGETGLDFNRNFSTPANQENAFTEQIELAIEYQKPLFLHERDATQRFSAIMQTYRDHIGVEKPINAVVHCFTGNETALKTYLDMGLFIGITGWLCDKKRGEELRDIIQYAPIERLMIETDAPYLTPNKETLNSLLAIKHRNEPWTLKYTANQLAQCLNIDSPTLQKITRKNSRLFFQLD